MSFERRINVKEKNVGNMLSLDARAHYSADCVSKRRPISCPDGGLRLRSTTSSHTQASYSLKPQFDSSAGLDRWPANLGTSTKLVNVNKDSCPALVEENLKKLQPNIPKPRFLGVLETFIHNELKHLDVEDKASMLRLQVYRQAFDLLINHFKTYQPILVAIKQEYERTLAHQREQLRKCTPLKQMLVTVSEDCDKKIMAMRDRERQDIEVLVAEKRLLQEKVETLESTCLCLEQQVNRLHGDLERDHCELREEQDARKLLMVKLNELRLQHDDMSLGTQSYLQELEEKKADPVILKIALRAARTREKGLMDQIEKLETEIASFVNVVPSKDYEQIRTKNKKLDHNLRQMKEEMCKVKEDFENLQDRHTEMNEQKQRLQEELDSLKTRSLTPRPDWSRCADHIAGGIVRWREVTRGKHSDELVTVLLRELTKTPGVETDETDSLRDSTGEEGVLLLMCQLAILLTQHNMETTRDGLIKRADLQVILQEFFPTKDETAIAALLKCADFQLDTNAYDKLPYTKLFWENREGKMGEFLEELSSQYYRERREYVEDILEELGHKDPVMPEDLQRAISITDPEITSHDLDKYLCSAFYARGRAELEEAEPVAVATLLSRLQRGSVRRIGKTGRRSDKYKN